MSLNNSCLRGASTCSLKQQQQYALPQGPIQIRVSQAPGGMKLALGHHSLYWQGKVMCQWSLKQATVKFIAKPKQQSVEE